MKHLLVALVLVFTSTASVADTQYSQRFGPYELHYIVLPTTFLKPEVASAYGITRGSLRALINVSLREHLPDGTNIPREMVLTGSSKDLLAKEQTLEFTPVKEQGAIYYLAEFRFLNEEWRQFQLTFSPDNSEQRYKLNFKQQLFKE